MSEPALKLIDRMLDHLLIKQWAPLHDACGDRKLRFPGIYLIAFSGRRLEGQQAVEKDVFYVGMSLARFGVQYRLKQFRSGLEDCDHHSGAMRFYKTIAKGPFSKMDTRRRFYATAYVIPECERRTPADWRAMGHVSCLECYAIARVLQKTKRIPKLNRSKN